MEKVTDINNTFFFSIILLIAAALVLGCEPRNDIVINLKYQAYGEMYNYTPHLSPYTFDITEDDVYFNLTGLVAGDLNGFTYSTGTLGLNDGSHLTADVDGLYKVCLSMTFTSTAVGGTFGFSAAKNFNEKLSRDCYARREASTDIGNMGVCCLIYFELGDTVNIKVENEDNTRDLVIHTVNLNLFLMGD